MGAGGAAPPVKGDDVMILVGSSILLVTFILHLWVSPIAMELDSIHTVKHDMSEGDTFTVEVLDGVVNVNTILPSEEKVYAQEYAEDEWVFTAEESGVHTFEIQAVDPAEITTSVSRGIILDFGLYLVGAAILGFGIWKRLAAASEEPMEAVLED